VSGRTDHLAASVLDAFVRGVRALPQSWVRPLGGLLGSLVYRLDARHPRVARRNLETALPELSHSQAEGIARRCFRRQGSLALDNIRLATFDPAEMCRRLDLEGWDNFHQAEAAGRGVLIFSAHLGVHDLLAHAVPLYKGPLDIVARPTGKRRVDTLLADMRKVHGNRLIAKRGAVWGMLEALRRGGRVAILLDQRVHPNEGIEVPFFGRMSWTSPFPARVCQRTGAPALPIFSYQTAGGRYRLVARPPIFPRGEGERETTRLCTAFLAAIEREVRAQPEEWLWMHERWRRH